MSTSVPDLADMTILTKIANTIRGLSMDAVQKANSGHPGAPMGLADFAAVLTTKWLRVSPSRPDWPDRDRFVLSAGHASMLQYSILHLMGFDLTLEDLREFRQWGSKTPGHPEHGETPGVETTTGPLGQGIANAVGMALAERMLAARFNTADRKVVDHTTWVIAGDGDMMEGVQAEAVSLAGHLGLGRLIVFYDSNGITIDGKTSITFDEEVGQRFQACGWHVQTIDGHDHEAIDAAIEQARAVADRPSLIVGKTHIAYGSPGKQDTSASHGAPLGEDEVAATKRNLGWPLEPAFFVPPEVYEFYGKRRENLEGEADWWERKLRDFEEEEPERHRAFLAQLAGDLPEELPRPAFETGKSIATRKASGKALNALAEAVPALVGGSADLAGSNNTDLAGAGVVGRGDYAGRILRFGVREHAMAAVSNGLSLHGGFRPFAATFLIFSDYMRPAIRLSALMRQPVLYVFTHDSFWVGEDGPTHEPIEQLAGLRSVPGLVTLRPADATETAVAWEVALRRTDGPTALVLTRQGLPVLDRAELAPADGLARGGYVLFGGGDEPDLILVATGSEVSLALEAGRRLRGEGVRARVVSLPSFELFAAQPAEYRESVLPAACRRRVGVEAAIRQGWDRWIGADGAFLGMDRFGASAPGKVNAEKFGFTVEGLLSVVRTMEA